MIIGLNLLYLLPGVVGGTETYAAGLLKGLAAHGDESRFVVFVNRESAAWPLPASPRFRRVVCPVHARSRLARYRFEQLRLPALVQAEGVELLHSLGYVAPLRLGRPSVVTVHDLHYRSYGPWRQWPRRLLLDCIVGASIRRAAAVITVSRFMRDAIART
ncbi:MAG TPA: glycosyltransferase, partial [Gemmatimonadales bacterium]|nr:glycosyltransferase [Gemmatimonadales bacterium]